MTARTSKAKASESRPMVVEAHKDESEAQSMSRVMVAPYVRHGTIAEGIADKMIGKGKLPGEPRFDDYGHDLKARADKIAGGDMKLATELLTAQALSLDAIFTEYARRSILNAGEYLDAADRYMRIAMKAQAGSRQAIEALGKLHQPREQTVRHVHVNEGGQAVIADEFHHHTGGRENGQSSEQPHATGTGAAGASPALPCPDPLGPAVPIPGGEGQGPVPDARRQGQRGT